MLNFSLQLNLPKYLLDNVILHTTTDDLVFLKVNKVSISLHSQIYFIKHAGLPLFLFVMPLISQS